MDERKLLMRMARGAVANVAFADLQRLAEALGFELRRVHGDEDAAYVADIPDLEACSALGATAEEAVAEVKIAKEAWLAAARENGRPVPEPRYRRRSIRARPTKVATATGAARARARPTA